MVEVSRRSLLQGLLGGAAALALPWQPTVQPLPSASGQRMLIPLCDSVHPLLPIHLADAFAQMEILDNRVAKVFLSPRRLADLQQFETPKVAMSTVWGATIEAVDLPDDVLVLEAGLNGAAFDPATVRVRSVQLESRSI